MNNIDVFIGTKAQYIKTAPLLRLFAENEVPYRLIDSGQHAAFAPELRKELGIKEPDYVLKSKGNIKSVVEAALWFARYFFLTIFQPKKVRTEVFSQGAGYCVIHGDTPTTLLSLIMAKRSGKKVAHLEAGLRSYNFFKPFPEELIRIICMRYADVLFTPSAWAVENLKKMKTRGQIVNLGQNTNVEALHYSLDNVVEKFERAQPYCLVTVHRVETILNRRRLEFVLHQVDKIAETLDVIFILHDPTRKKLDDFGLMSHLEGKDRIDAQSLVSHEIFLQMMDGAEFVITDGGSIQEETFYLDVPCLVMRNETERNEGLDANVRLSDFDEKSVNDFVRDYAQLRTGHRVENKSPSAIAYKLLVDAEGEHK